MEVLPRRLGSAWKDETQSEAPVCSAAEEAEWQRRVLVRSPEASGEAAACGDPHLSIFDVSRRIGRTSSMLDVHRPYTLARPPVTPSDDRV